MFYFKCNGKLIRFCFLFFQNIAVVVLSEEYKKGRKFRSGSEEVITITQARNDGYLYWVLTVEQDKNRHILEAHQQDFLTDQMWTERKWFLHY